MDRKGYFLKLIKLIPKMIKGKKKEIVYSVLLSFSIL